MKHRYLKEYESLRDNFYAQTLGIDDLQRFVEVLDVLITIYSRERDTATVNILNNFKSDVHLRMEANFA